MDEARVTTLDWSRWYADRGAWPIDRNMFLAEAVLSLGPMMVFPWLDDFPVATTAAPAPILPGTLDAFDGDGRPRPEIYARWAPAVSAYMSATEYASIRLRDTDRSAWLASHVVDPETGRARFQAGEASGNEPGVSRDHWHHASWEAAVINEDRAAGIAAMPHLARAIATMALEGDIRCWARPIGGGEHVPVDPDDWLVDEGYAVRTMLATSGLGA